MHLLGQHIIDVQCSSQPLGKEIQNTLSDLLEKTFYPQLEILLDRYSVQNYNWEIDHLSVQLPDISQKEWKKELIEQSLIQVEEYLKNNSITTKSNINEKIHVEQGFIPQAAYLENIFTEYLKTGILKENLFSDRIDEIIAAIEVSEVFIKELLTVLYENKKALIRYYFNVPDFFKEKIKYEPVNNYIYDDSIKIFNFLNSNTEFYSTEELESYIEAAGLYSENKKENYSSSEKDHHPDFEKNKLNHQELNGENTPDTGKTIEKNTKSTEITEDQDSFINVKETHLQEKQENTDLTEDSKQRKIKEKSSRSTKSFQQSEKKLEKNHYTVLPSSSLYIENAGLVILHPFLQTLFKKLNLCTENDWKQKNSQHKAIMITQYLVTGQEIFFENELVLNKLLCGFPIDDVANTRLKISKKEKETCNDLLSAVTEHWSTLKGSSVQALRETFLQRSGKLSLNTQSSSELWVEEKGVDVLLAGLPWGIGMIQTPWMEAFLNIYWRY
ncbi:contractile injection system tape measure protein [Chryseobacterium tongliaoense]|uniref:contractile injection system tape measure protein n=1 Tax=Chryseobacterium tongliaoense TaxID=3240933 RepID=UPI00351391F9